MIEELAAVFGHALQLCEERNSFLVVVDCHLHEIVHSVPHQNWKEMLLLESCQEFELFLEICEEAFSCFDSIVGRREELFEELVGLVRGRLAEASASGHRISLLLKEWFQFT
nr:hypothetical protein [Microvirga sp. KLBC 81]